MSSSTVNAQRLANQANIHSTQATNEAQVAIAESANRWNWNNLQAQNEWNIQQWERENVYNSPSAQMERYIKAGINPLWAISNGNPGNAQHLESGSPQPAEVPQLQAPHVEPEYDPSRLSSIVAASRDVVNAGLGFSRLGLERMDVDTRRMAQQSQANLNLASAAQKIAATTGQEIENRWNLDTFNTRAMSEQQKLSNMRKQLDLMDSQSESYRAMKSNYEASAQLAREKYSRIAEDYQLAWKRIGIDLMDAQSRRISASASSSMASTAADRLTLDSNMAKATVAKWNNDQLLDYLKNFGQNISGEMKASVGVEGLGVSGKAGVQEKGLPTMSTFEAAGLRAIQWAADEPDNPKAVEAATIAVEKTNKIDNDLSVPYDSPSPGSSSAPVLNPPPVQSFGSWSSWQ